MLFKKNELKGKGFDRQKVKSKVPKELKKVDGHTEKPTIELNFSDYLNRFVLWLKDSTDYVLEKAFSNLIPRWFFLAILGIIILVILWFIFT